jgi:hypothetical protein
MTRRVTLLRDLGAVQYAQRVAFETLGDCVGEESWPLWRASAYWGEMLAASIVVPTTRLKIFFGYPAYLRH